MGGGLFVGRFLAVLLPLAASHWFYSQLKNLWVGRPGRQRIGFEGNLPASVSGEAPDLL